MRLARRFLALLLVAAAGAAAAGPVPGTTLHRIDEPVLGGEMAVHEAGPANGPAILLVHGIGDNGARDYQFQIAWLRESWHVVAPDLPGFAESDKANALYSPANYAQVLKRIADRFIRRPFVLVGHSMGGVAALRYAATYPQDVERLVVIDAPGVLHPLSSTSQFAAFLGATFMAPEVDSSQEIADLARRLLAPLARLRPDPQIVLNSPQLRQALLEGDPVRIAGLAAVSEDLRDALPRLRMPTLLVWGASDRLAPPRVGRVLERTLPDASLQLMEGVGHTPMIEAPARFRALVEPFLATGILPKRERHGPDPTARGDAECRGERGRVFEGKYDRLVIEGCTRAVVRNASARELRVVDSSVTLLDSEIGGGPVGLYARNASVVATGGRISGDVAILSSASRFDLAALELAGRQAAIQAVAGDAAAPPPASLAVLSMVRVRSPGTRGEVREAYTVTPEAPL
ncbi:MAG TPA: alpha/beta hydrolase [Burkholderiales bacterium]|nr:alpha/beta hydrolase [Burkholderiales bacterium]